MVEVGHNDVCRMPVRGQDRNVTTEKPPLATVPVQHAVTAGVLSPGDNKADHRESQEWPVVGMHVLDIIAKPDGAAGLFDAE